MFGIDDALLQIGAPALISFLSSRIGAGAQYGRQRRLGSTLNDLYSPQRLVGDANSLFDAFRASPVYGSLRSNAMNSANSLANQFRSSFARRGLTNSGIAGIAEPAARGSFAQSFANIDADLFSKALSMARENISTRAGITERLWQPSIGAQTASGTINSLLPFIYQFLKRYGIGTKGIGEDLGRTTPQSATETMGIIPNSGSFPSFRTPLPPPRQEQIFELLRGR